MRHRRRLLVTLILQVFLWCGCAMRGPGFYRVVKIHDTHYLLPPGHAEDPERRAAEFQVRVDGVARHSEANCTVNLREFALYPGRGGRVNVDVRPADLFAAGGTVRAYRAAFGRFRGELSRLEEEGCLKPGAGRMVAERVAESLPVPLMESIFYVYGYDPFHGYCEVHPGMRLNAQRALLKPGPDGKDRLVRIDRAVYSVAREPGGEGLRFKLHKRTGNQAAIPGLERLRQPFSRFFFHVKFPSMEGKPLRTAVLLSAGSLRRLESTTNLLWNDPGLTCSGTQAGIECVKSPGGQIVTAEIPLKVNGKEIMIPLSFTIHDVLSGQRAVRRGGPLPDVEMRRLFRGRLTPVRFESREAGALALPVTPGDRLEWRLPQTSSFQGLR